jgi:hypothetical protein
MMALDYNLTFPNEKLALDDYSMVAPPRPNRPDNRHAIDFHSRNVS